jgi:UDP-N-acetylglucosamine:LPS N-acetylglucosamine transferase
MPKTVFLIASRTGGPLIPLLALKDYLENSLNHQSSKPNDNLNFVIVGIKGGFEEKIAQMENIPIVFLPEVKLKKANLRFEGLAGKIIQKIENATLVVFTAFGVLYSCLICVFYLIKFKPKLILSTSNFLSVPMIWSAAFLNQFLSKNKIKIAIHLLDPQNTTIGLTARFADLLSAGFLPVVQKLEKKFGNRVLLSPNPVREKIFKNLEKNQCKYSLVEASLITKKSLEKPLLLIFGGGSGAEFINNWVRSNLETLTEYWTVLHLTGFLQKQNLENIVQNSENSFYFSTAGLTDYMATALVASDLVIARAGMSSISELLYLQKPALLVPIPNSHQLENAKLVTKYFKILDQGESKKWSTGVQAILQSDFEFWKSINWDVYPKNYQKTYMEKLVELLE